MKALLSCQRDSSKLKHFTTILVLTVLSTIWFIVLSNDSLQEANYSMWISNMQKWIAAWSIGAKYFATIHWLPIELRFLLMNWKQIFASCEVITGVIYPSFVRQLRNIVWKLLGRICLKLIKVAKKIEEICEKIENAKNDSMTTISKWNSLSNKKNFRFFFEVFQVVVLAYD